MLFADVALTPVSRQRETFPGKLLMHGEAGGMLMEWISWCPSMAPIAILILSVMQTVLISPFMLIDLLTTEPYRR